MFADILRPGVSAGGRFLSGMICVLPICLPDGLIVCPLGATIVGIKALEYLKFIHRIGSAAATNETDKKIIMNKISALLSSVIPSTNHLIKVSKTP